MKLSPKQRLFAVAHGIAREARKKYAAEITEANWLAVHEAEELERLTASKLTDDVAASIRLIAQYADCEQ